MPDNAQGRTTKRPVSPGAEELLGLYFPVLDHGFVSLVDYMGTDECVERAARVSYGYGTRKTSQTRGLLRYLRRHLHTTPSEMVEFKFHCCMPMFVARQWIRHRTACLAGDAKLSFDLPGGERRGRRQHHGVSIADFHRMWHEGTAHPIAKKKPGYFATRTHTAHVEMKARLGRMRLRSCNEDTGEIMHTRVVDIWESGVKPVFRVTLANGRSLKMSKDHRCLTERGWLTLEEACNLQISETGAVTWSDAAPAFAVNGVPAYQDPGWLAQQRGAGLTVEQMAMLAGASYHTIRKYLQKHGLQFTAKEKARLSGLAQRGQRRTFQRKPLELLSAAEQGADLATFWADKHRQPRPSAKRLPRSTRLVRSFSKVVRIELAGEEMTYDLEVEGPYHNFVADGFIVHNSVNEYSGRYSLMPMLFYTPSADELQTQSKQNNQGRSGQPVTLAKYQEAVRRWNEIRDRARGAYEWMTSEEVARELARIDLPLSTYTQWYWKIDLHNLQHFLKLRVDPHAQWEIQEFGRIMAGMLKRVAPLSYEAWIDYDVCGERLSRMDLDALRKLVTVSGGKIESKGAALGTEELEGLGLAKREVRELVEKLTPRSVPDFELDLSRALGAEVFAQRFAEAVPKVDKPPAE